MKNENLFMAMNGLDPRLIMGSAPSDQAKKQFACQAPWLKWASIAACFCVILVGAVVTALQIRDRPNGGLPDVTAGAEQPSVIENPQSGEGTEPAAAIEGSQSNELDVELVYVERYIYQIDEGRFSAYVGGKVIDEELLGGKLEDVTLTAGWVLVTGDRDGNPESPRESLRGEVYAIAGIESDVAIAVKFIDKGEALTTTHYYVMMNPQADLSDVEEYIIPPFRPDISAETNMLWE